MNVKNWGGIAVFVLRIAAGVAAVGCFIAGLWSMPRDPRRGVSLMGLGIILGVVFGRYPPGSAAAVVNEDTDAG